MRRWHGKFNVFIGLLLVFGMIFSLKQSVYADSISDKRNGILPTKTWTITFNSNVDYDFVNQDYISVKTLAGKSVDVKLEVEPTNQKKVYVTPSSGQYSLSETYLLTIKQGFSDEKGNKLKQDRVMQFTIKDQIIDTADFKVQVNNEYGIVVISINSISDPSIIKKYRVEGQDEKDDAVDVNGGEAYITDNKLQNLNVYFYDANGNQIGSSLINVQNASDSQVVKIEN